VADAGCGGAHALRGPITRCEVTMGDCPNL
jgi:hypothetical protein